MHLALWSLESTGRRLGEDGGPRGRAVRSAADHGLSRRGLQGHLRLSPGVYRLCCVTITTLAAENTCSLLHGFCGPEVATRFPAKSQQAAAEGSASCDFTRGPCGSRRNLTFAIARLRPPWSWELSAGTPQLFEVPLAPCHVPPYTGRL